MKSSSEDVAEKLKCKNREKMLDSAKHSKKKKAKKSPAKESSKKSHKHKKDKKALKEKKHKKNDKDKSPKRAQDKTSVGMLDKGFSNSSLITSVSNTVVSKRACYRQNVKSTNKESENSRESSIEIIYEEKHNVVTLSDSEMIIDDSDETLRKRLEACIQNAHLRQAENSEENKIASDDIKTIEKLPRTFSNILVNNCSKTNVNLNGDDVMDISEIPIPETAPILPSDERHSNNPLHKRGKKLNLKISLESVAFISSGVKIQSSQNENSEENVKVSPPLDLRTDASRRSSPDLSQDCNSSKQRKDGYIGKHNNQTEIKNSGKREKSKETLKGSESQRDALQVAANKIGQEESAKNRDGPKSQEKSKRSRPKSRDGSKSRNTSRKKSRRSRSRSEPKSKSRRSRSRSGSKSKSRRTRSRSGSSKRLKNKSKKSKRSRDRSEPRKKSSDKSKRDRSRSRGGLKRSREGSEDRGSKKRARRSKDGRSMKRSKSREMAKESRDKSRARSKTKKSRDHSKPRNRSKSREKSRQSREQSAGSKRSKRSGSNDDQPSFKIDKVKLRQIAIKNALQNANLAARQQTTTTAATTTKPEDTALLKSGGKTLEELTEFCKKIAEVSAEEIQGFIDGSTQLIDEEEMPFIPARTNKDMKNGPILNQMTLQEKMVQMAEISSLFPVSSGNVHKEREATNVAGTVDVDGVAPVDAKQSEISAVENSVPKSSFSKDVLMASKWVSAKEIPGQFTGSTNVQTLSQQELSGSYPLWVKKDALNNAPPLSGGIGKLLLKKMGWKEGEGLGKNSEGMTVPLSIDIKTDRKGLVAPEEDPERIQKLALERALVHQAMMKQAMFQQAVLRQALMMRPNLQSQAASQFLQMPLPHGILPLRMPPPRPNLTPRPIPNLTPPPCPQAVSEVSDITLGKHPVSVLTEICSKNHWDPPEFILLEESGPAHNKMFKFKIILNGVEYISPNGCPQKKTAKLEAAIVCLKHLGLLPHMPNN